MLNIKIGGVKIIFKKLAVLIMLIFTITILSGTVSAVNPYNTTLVSNSSTGNGGNHESTFPSMSADGNLIVYSSTSTNLIPNKTTTYYENIFLFNKSSGKTILVTKGSNGNGGNRDSYHPSISGDGTTIAFASCASNLLPGRVINTTANIYIYDVNTGITQLITEGPGGAGVNGDCGHPSINYDGTVIAYESKASNIYKNMSKKTNTYEIFVTYMDSFGERNNTLISNDADFSGAGDNRYPSISGNGRLITYFSEHGRLREDNRTVTYGNIDLYDMDEEENYLISYGAIGNGGNSASNYPRISADGSTIVFASFATDMIYGTLTNSNENIFVYNDYTGLILITRGSSGNGGNGYSSRPSINEDGTIITFYSTATDLVPGMTTNGQENIFIYNMSSGKMGLLSTGSGGKGGNDGSFNPVINYNGNAVAFQSSATDLIKGKTITSGQIYVTYVNNGPLAVNDSATLNEDTTTTIPILNNDSDEDGDTLIITTTTKPLHGTITINSDKTITYKPNSNYNGLDSFSYTITDGKNGFSTATVKITVYPS